MFICIVSIEASHQLFSYLTLQEDINQAIRHVTQTKEYAGCNCIAGVDFSLVYVDKQEKWDRVEDQVSENDQYRYVKTCFLKLST